MFQVVEVDMLSSAYVVTIQFVDWCPTGFKVWPAGGICGNG